MKARRSQFDMMLDAIEIISIFEKASSTNILMLGNFSWNEMKPILVSLIDCSCIDKFFEESNQPFYRLTPRGRKVLDLYKEIKHIIPFKAKLPFEEAREKSTVSQIFQN